ncbi:MAG: hypothetical protein K5981_07985 [Clostridia bacterium]|nr:hypothetical protein [Clostridia bacterium]
MTKKAKKMTALLMVLAMAIGLAACTQGARADAQLQGKYTAVAGEAMGVTLLGEDLEGFDMELQSGGKGTAVIDGKEWKMSWSNDDETVTIKLDGEELKGTLGEDIFVIDDIGGSGLKVTFAKEGTDAAKPENYLPAAEKFMLGCWQSTEVSDILGGEIDMDPNALFMVFTADKTASIMFNGEDIGTYEWSLLGDWGSLDGDDAPDVSWSIKDSVIEVNYAGPEGEYYVFTCPKEGGESFSGSSGGFIPEFWDREWYGWWVMGNATGDYEEINGNYWDVCGAIYMDSESDNAGYVYLWDETGSIDDPVANVDVQFVPGTSEIGKLVSTGGWFFTNEIERGEWEVDPAHSTVVEYENMIEIMGSCEDGNGSFDYAIYLRPWGMSWDDVAEKDEDMMPYNYEWYKGVMNDVMPESFSEEN